MEAIYRLETSASVTSRSAQDVVEANINLPGIRFSSGSNRFLESLALPNPALRIASARSMMLSLSVELTSIVCPISALAHTCNCHQCFRSASAARFALNMPVLAKSFIFLQAILKGFYHFGPGE